MENKGKPFVEASKPSFGIRKIEIRMSEALLTDLFVNIDGESEGSWTLRAIVWPSFMTFIFIPSFMTR